MSAPEDLPYFHVVSKKEADGNVTTVVMMPTDVHASETCKLRQLRMVMPDAIANCNNADIIFPVSSWPSKIWEI